MIPRFGEPVRRGQRYGIRQGAYAIVLRGHEVLLTRQDGPRPEFQLPGGGLDRGESPLRALHREVAEETGWRIAAPRRLGAFRRFVYMPDYEKWAEKLCTVYLARPLARLGPPTEAGHDAFWLPAPIAADLLGNAGDQFYLRLAMRQLGLGPR